ncbi:MAG: helix-turn-helix transcriptional regulator [Solirubrobacteraceae bacterium]
MGAHSAVSWPLLERDRELERISAALASARNGTGVAAIVEGSAGIGKTALLSHAKSSATQSGMLVLAARGLELEAGYPFGLVRQCFEPALRSAERRERQRLLSGAAGLAAPAVLDAPADVATASFGVLHGLYWLAANLADAQPLLIAIDDAHWADEPSLRFLTHLLARIESLPAALIVTTRPAGPPLGEPGPLIGLLADRAHDLLTPAPLGESAVAELLRRGEPETLDEQFARACRHASGGNPFLLTELERTLREEGVPFTAAGAQRVGEVTPPQVARMVRARLARLGPATRAIARAAVILGDDSPLELVSELAELDWSAATVAADELADAGLVEHGRLIRYRHPLLRSAVAGSLTLAESEELHLAAVRLLRSRRAPAERVAVHLLAAAPTGEPIDLQTLRDAASRAVQQGAPEGAIPPLERALEEPVGAPENATLELELGRAKLGAGQLDDAVEHFGAVVRATSDAELRAQALLPLLQNHSSRSSDDYEAQLRLIEPTLDEIGPDDRELWLRLQAYSVISPDSEARIDPAQLDELTSLAGDTPGEAVVLAHLIFRRIRLGDSADDIAAIATRAARQLDALVEDGSSALAFSAIILGLRWSDRLDLAERLLDRAVGIARRRGSMLDFANSLDLRSEVYVRRGLLRDAEADARDSLATRIEKSWLFARGVKPLLQSLAHQGRTDEAEQLMQKEFGDAPLANVPPMIGLIYAQAEVLAAAGKHAAAVEAFDDAVKRGQKWGGPSPSQIGDILVAARSSHALGDQVTSHARLAEADVFARQWGTPGVLGEVMHAMGMLEADHDQLDVLREAVALLERSPARLELARALVDLGGALRRASHRRDSRDPLQAGYELACECGAEPLAATARQELVASGVRVLRERLTGAQSLTPSEWRIAQMVANGGSNAEIAQALFVTVKTVEMHLTSIYRKLDITGRAQLPRALNEPAPNEK